MIRFVFVSKVASQNGARLLIVSYYDCYVQRLFLDDIVIRIESKHEVTILGGLNEFIVKFFGPSGCKCEHISMCCYRL